MLSEKQIDSILFSLKVIELNGKKIEYVCCRFLGDKKNIKEGVKIENVRNVLPKYYFLEIEDENKILELSLKDVLKVLPIEKMLSSV
jgi:hypothetical protein